MAFSAAAPGGRLGVLMARNDRTPQTEPDHFQIFYKVPDPDPRLERLPAKED